MTEPPTFSIIIPVFNGESTIGRAIDSVIQQTYKNFELIVVDDGSSDGTEAIIRGYGSSLKHIHQENAGAAAARNRGVQAANGRWLVFLDSDDWFYPTRLEIHARILDEDPDLDFLTGGFDAFQEDGAFINNSMASTTLGTQLMERANGKSWVSLKEHELGDFVAHQFSDVRCLTVPRKTFVELDGFPEDFAICEDVHFIIRLCAQSHRVGVACVPLAAYVVHDHGLVRSNVLRAQEQTVAALIAVRKQLTSAPQVIMIGLNKVLFRARCDLATVLLRYGQRHKAFRAVIPLLKDQPGWLSVRAVLSVLKG